MKTIHKYYLNLARLQELKLPLGSIPLDIQRQDNALVIWMLLDSEETRMTTRYLYAYYTGEPVPSVPGTHIKTLILGGLVYHFFLDDNERT